MSQLTVTKESAIKAYNNADDKGKTLLSNLYGQEVFNQNITDRVKSYEDAAIITGKTVSFSGDSKDEKAYKMLKTITEALNEGWTPDWSNSNQPKYYPYFKMSPFGFCGTVYVWARSDSPVGSRLCFKTAALAEYAGKQFESIYKDLLTF